MSESCLWQPQSLSAAPATAPPGGYPTLCDRANCRIPLPRGKVHLPCGYQGSPQLHQLALAATALPEEPPGQELQVPGVRREIPAAAPSGEASVLKTQVSSV